MQTYKEKTFIDVEFNVYDYDENDVRTFHDSYLTFDNMGIIPRKGEKIYHKYGIYVVMDVIYKVATDDLYEIEVELKKV